MKNNTVRCKICLLNHNRFGKPKNPKRGVFFVPLKAVDKNVVDGMLVCTKHLPFNILYGIGVI